MGAVGPVGVVVDSPVFGQHLDLSRRVELAAARELVAETAVEPLDPGVLPRRSRVDQVRPNRVEPAPVRLLRHRRRSSFACQNPAQRSGDVPPCRRIGRETRCSAFSPAPSGEALYWASGMCVGARESAMPMPPAVTVLAPCCECATRKRTLRTSLAPTRRHTGLP